MRSRFLRKPLLAWSLFCNTMLRLMRSRLCFVSSDPFWSSFTFCWNWAVFRQWPWLLPAVMAFRFPRPHFCRNPAAKSGTRPQIAANPTECPKNASCLEVQHGFLARNASFWAFCPKRCEKIGVRSSVTSGLYGHTKGSHAVFCIIRFGSQSSLPSSHLYFPRKRMTLA